MFRVKSSQFTVGQIKLNNFDHKVCEEKKKNTHMINQCFCQFILWKINTSGFWTAAFADKIINPLI